MFLFGDGSLKFDIDDAVVKIQGRPSVLGTKWRQLVRTRFRVLSCLAGKVIFYFRR